MPKTLDDLFEGIITELETALDLAIRADRDRRLDELDRRCAALSRLAKAALEVSRAEGSKTPKKSLD